MKMETLHQRGIEMIVQPITFDNLNQSVEVTAKVCTDAMVTGSQSFANKLWGLKHQTPFEHNTYRVKSAKLASLVSIMKDANIYNPAFRVDESGDYVYGSYRAFRNAMFNDEDIEWVSEAPSDVLRRTFYIETNIGISREMVRHRSLSFTERSTRYVKEHDSEFTRKFSGFGWVWSHVTITYKELQERKIKRDLIRELLPLGTKTALYATGFLDQWEDFIALRCAPGAHIAIQAIANKIDEYITL